jgi:hypothetical protein
LQVLHLRAEQGNLLALPFDQLLLPTDLLLQAAILLSQLFFFGCHGFTVVAFSSLDKPSRTPE